LIESQQSLKFGDSLDCYIRFFSVQAGARSWGNKRLIYHAQDSVIALKRVFPGIFRGSGVEGWGCWLKCLPPGRRLRKTGDSDEGLRTSDSNGRQRPGTVFSAFPDEQMTRKGQAKAARKRKMWKIWHRTGRQTKHRA